jgi:hypothetical protein
VGIPTSRNPDTLDGLEGWLSVKIRRISVELPHSNQTRARKTLSNSNGFQQSFYSRATPRTPNKSGSPPALRTSPLSLLYKDRIWKPIVGGGGGLNLTLFLLSFGGSTVVFIGGVRRCFG